jgi:hypothetical protein
MKNPTKNAPLLAGLLVDVSGSMTSAIQNKSGTSMNRLQSFQAALGDLAKSVEQSAFSSGTEGETIQLFAYGFGFGNPLSFLFGGEGKPVRDLLEVGTVSASTIGLRYLARNWGTYKAHVESLALQMFGETPMLEAFRIARERFASERKRLQPSSLVLLVVSDGEPTSATPQQVMEHSLALKADGVTVVSCYITAQDLTVPRHLYGRAVSDWPAGARLMFDCSSELPHGSGFDGYLRENGWHIEDRARLFTQVNQSEVLAEFIGMLGSSITSPSPGQQKEILTSFAHTSTGTQIEKNAMAKKHIFLSYCHDNESDVAQLRDELIAAGEAVWWDKDILLGQDWKQEIRRAMKDSYAVVLCLSKELAVRVESGVFPEVSDAISVYRKQAPGGVFLIPIRLSACAIPDIEIDDTRTLDRLQSTDLFPVAKRGAGLQKLLVALKASPNHP